eukprot:362713-Chlamydomonas_euryale.AAC.15
MPAPGARGMDGATPSSSCSALSDHTPCNASCPGASHTSGRPAASHSPHPGASDTTSPMTSSVGDRSAARLVHPGRSPKRENTTRCSGVVPRSTATAGVPGGMPAADSWRNSAGSAPAIWLTSNSSPPSRAWPVRKRTLVATPRCVIGMPSSAQMPLAAVMPGTQ